MNSIERARDLSRKIPELKKLQDEKQWLDKYAAFRTKLEDLTTALEGLAGIADELRKKGWEVTGFKVAAQGMLTETRKVIAAFGNDKSSSIAPQTSQTFWTPLEAMPKKICNVLEKEWKNYVESKIPSDQTDILEILSKVQGFSDQTTTVHGLFSKMRSLGGQLPKKGDFELLDTLANQVQQAWESLDVDGLPPTVLDFLKKAHTNGFSLADLNDDVLNWLKEKNLLGQYAIRSK